MTKPPPSEISTRPTLVLAAMRCEITTAARELKLSKKRKYYRGHHNKTKIIAAVIGIGPTHAKNQTAKLIEQHNPKQIILIGFSAGLDPEIKTGSIIRPDHVVNENLQAIKLHQHKPPQIINCENYNHSRILTVDHGVSTTNEKQDLFKKYNATAVDMESYSIAQLAFTHNIPLIIRRAISDDANTMLPKQVFTWISKNGETRPFRILIDLIKNISLLNTILQLASAGSIASKSLASEVKKLLS